MFFINIIEFEIQIYVLILLKNKSKRLLFSHDLDLNRVKKQILFKISEMNNYSASLLIRFIANPASFSRELDFFTLAFNIILLQKCTQFRFYK